MVDSTTLSYRFIHGLLTHLPGSGGGNLALGLLVVLVGAHGLQLPLLLKFRKAVLTRKDLSYRPVLLAVAFTELVPLGWAIFSAPIWFSWMEWPGWIKGGGGIGLVLLLGGTIPLGLAIRSVFQKRHFHRRAFEKLLRELDEATLRQQMGADWQKVEQALTEARRLEDDAAAAGKAFDQAAVGAYQLASKLLCLTATKAGPLLRLARDVSIQFVPITAGQFMMGSPDQEEGRYAGETLHAVKLSAFHLAATTVTQEQYQAVMGKNPSHFKGEKNPVEEVSRIDAQTFCERLSQKTGRHFRLPTEAEWEYACRAGTTTAYYTGARESDLDQAGWYDGNSNRTTHPVGQKQPNAWGLYDMHGNVRERCHNASAAYPTGPVTDPTGAEQILAPSRVLRGGSWYNGPRYCRSADRSGYAPDGRSSDIGFRACLDFP